MSIGNALVLEGAFDPPAALRSIVSPCVECTAEEDVAQQQFKNEVDMNTIVKRFGYALELNVGAAGPGEFGDFSAGVDFQAAMNRVVEAQQAFARLPAALRARFGNDPARFLDYVHSSDNVAEAVELGILDRSALAAPVVVESAVAEGGGTPAS